VPTKRHEENEETRTRGRKRRLSAVDAAAAAAEQLSGFIAAKPTAVTSVEPANDGDGWFVGIEIVEERRVPSSSDMLAMYEVELDPDGELQAYRRTRRYLRGRPSGPNGKEAT
jgi:hypothetical protein